MATVARDGWTDERLDDLKGSVDSGFQDVRNEFRAVRTEMGEIRGEIGAMRRSIDQLAFGLIGAMLVGFLGTIAAIATQL